MSPTLQDAAFDDEEQVVAAMVEMLVERCGLGPRRWRGAGERGTNGRHRAFAALRPIAKNAARKSRHATILHAYLPV